MLAERIYSDVRVWRGPQPVGVGFVVDPTHVMTCAHVVTDALAPRAPMGDLPPAGDLTIDFPALQPRNGSPVTCQATVALWRPLLAGVRDDIAILRLATPVPSSIRAVQAGPGWQEDDLFRGFGVTSDNPEGKILAGKISGRTAANRFEITSERGDNAIVSGCSGGAVWSETRGGVVGMIVQRKLELSAEAIPIELLREAFPIAPLAETDRPPALRVEQTSSEYKLRLRLEHYDREPQFADFDVALAELWIQRKRAVTCLIACCDEDRPDVLQRRFLRDSLCAQFEAAQVSTRRLRAEQLAWPTRGRLDPARELLGLKAQLKRFLPGAADLSAAAFQRAYDDSLQPLVFFTKIEGKVFDESHAALLHAWLEFWQAFAGGDLRKPFVLFVRFHFDGSPGSAAMRAAYDEVQQAAIDVGPRVLAELAAFPEEDVIAWLGDEMEALDLDHARIETEIALKRLMAGQPIRLGGLLSWAESLPF